MAVSPAGDVYAAYRGGGHVVFPTSGQPIQVSRARFNPIRENWIFQPGVTQRRWVLGYREIYLVDGHDHVLKTITRRPDGDWLERVNKGAVAPDGSLAVVASPRGVGTRGPCVLCIYAADGEPVRTVNLGDVRSYVRVAWNGRIAVASERNELFLHDLQKASVRHFTLAPEAGQQDFWYLYCSPDGRELWVRNADSMTLNRYRLP
jgi:hypothetical protein